MSSKWDHRFMQLALHVAEWSKDPSTKVGAVIVGPSREVLSMGYNGFPRDMDDSPALYADREFKYRHIIHGEHNAVLNAARNGLSVRRATLYVTHPPCPHCAGTLKQSGIAEVIYLAPLPEFSQRWPISDTLNVFNQVRLPIAELHRERTPCEHPPISVS